MRDTWIGPSVLSADFLRLGEQLAELEAGGADYIHFDVMDGRFVPNISIGLPVLEATKSGTSLPVDVHLMIVEPDRWVEEFADHGADRITFHAEATPHMHRVVQTIEAKGKVPGVSINPATAIGVLEEILPYLGQVLIMTVNPGFGGQSFIDTSLDKIRWMREMIDRVNPDCRLQVDGGINEDTIRAAAEAGADMIVAGSAVFAGDRSPAENVARLRAKLD
ncbi:MAG TPA: ribulose-phosphate 3-epimerase [Thermomicrobiales bacterium]|nr:ribulose-phosphate 3-epimerase [Thermomicrobiales bacterium]